MDTKDAGRKGGNITKRKLGKAHYSKIGKKGRRVQLSKAKKDSNASR